MDLDKITSALEEMKLSQLREIAESITAAAAVEGVDLPVELKAKSAVELQSLIQEAALVFEDAGPKASAAFSAIVLIPPLVETTPLEKAPESQQDGGGALALVSSREDDSSASQDEPGPQDRFFVLSCSSSQWSYGDVVINIDLKRAGLVTFREVSKDRALKARREGAALIRDLSKTPDKVI